MSSAFSSLLILAVIHPPLAISSPRVSTAVIRSLPIPYASQRVALVKLVRRGMSNSDLEQILGRWYSGHFSGPFLTGTVQYDDVEIHLLESRVEWVIIKSPVKVPPVFNEDAWLRKLESETDAEWSDRIRANLGLEKTANPEH
jgi:hypothetical protein